MPAASPPTQALARVGLVVHGGRKEARDAAREAAQWFQAAGVAVCAVEGDDWEVGDAELRSPEGFAAGLDLVVVLGGDGTFLRAAYLARDCGVPLIGVNLGRLGFLSEIEAGGLAAMVETVTREGWAVEERMTLAIEVTDAEGAVTEAGWALNEASVKQVVPERLVVHEVAIANALFERVPADAIICATPTGSTAYAFSARGPVISPEIDAILVVPVAPHAIFDRAVVVDPSEPVHVTPQGDAECVVTLDGREHVRIPLGGGVRVARGEAPVRMARLGPFDFYGRVRQKFGLP